MLACLLPSAAAAQSPARVTVIYDAFGKPSSLKRGWGYSALVEYGGRRILFDTGGHRDDFARNVKTLGIDLSRLDFVVISHRHGDHTSGLSHVLSVNPKVPIYTPADLATFGGGGGVPGGALGKLVARKVESTPEDMRYFAGPAETQPSKPDGWPTPWPGANLIPVTASIEPIPGFYLFSTTSDKAGTREMNELSMAIRTPDGLVLVVGCSHPGIEKILDALVKIDARVYTVFGGFHLVDVSDAEVTRLADAFRDRWKIQRISAGHCTGQFAFSEFLRVYGDNYDRAGVGAVVALPGPRAGGR
jgi:7,8-dihydropterin-6-yl-methyl-4-(beta-D-ribofuranosyl)aminobenzene 5'-phosphate synthase